MLVQAEVDGSNGRVLDKFFVTAVRMGLDRSALVLVAWLHGDCVKMKSCWQVGGGKVTDAKDIDKLRSSLEKLVGPSGRSLARIPSGKRPVVGDSSAVHADHKVLLYNLKGGPWIAFLWLLLLFELLPTLSSVSASNL
jgi:hypothetical protein